MQEIKHLHQEQRKSGKVLLVEGKSDGQSYITKNDEITKNDDLDNESRDYNGDMDGSYHDEEKEMSEDSVLLETSLIN